MKIKKLLEKLELVYPADDTIGNTYFAHTKEDIISGLDKMTPGDAIGIFLKHKKYDETEELTIELIEPERYIMKLEEDTEENNNDWEGKNVLDTNPISKEDVVYTLNSLLQDYKIVSNKNESLLQDKINKIIKDEKLPYYIAYDEGDRIGIEVSGDWKHDHAYFNNLMRSNGFTLDDETVCDDEDNGGDYYTSIHYFTESKGQNSSSIKESLKGYKTVAKIIQNDRGYNVAEEDEPMLNQDEPTLKKLLQDLVKYL